MRVATNFQHQVALQRLQDANTNLATSTSQITSGLRAQRFSEIADDANQLLKLQDLQSNTTTFINNIEAASSRLEAQENALNSLSDLLVEAANLYTLARNENSPETRATLAPKAQGVAETFENIFTTKFNGRFIFSGQGSERSPLIGNLTANPDPGDPPPTAYYGGDTEKPSVVVGPGQAQEYGVTGDNVGFARMVAGFEALIFGLENDSEPDLDASIDFLRQAQKDLGDMFGEVGGDMAGLDLVKERHENAELFITERVDKLEKADVAEAMTKFSQEQAQLEASMAITTRLLATRLLDFLQ